MPQIQYSEKYYDDVYEYRCARAPTRLFPGARAGTGDLADARILALRARRPVGFLPATRRRRLGRRATRSSVPTPSARIIRRRDVL